MKPHDELTSRLTATLQERTDGLDGHPVTLARVQGRARQITRRRRATTAAAALAAVAVIVPATLLGGNLMDRTGEGPGPAKPTETPRTHTRVTLAPSLPQGDDVTIPYLENRTLHVPGSSDVELDESYGGMARIGDDWITSDSSDGGETFPVKILGPDGTLKREFTTQSGAVVSLDHTVAAWVTLEGQVTVMDQDGIRPIHTIAGDRLVTLRGIQGTSPCADSGGCAIYLGEQIGNTVLPEQVIRTGGNREPAPGDFTQIQAVSNTLLAGDLDRQGDPSKRTCDAVWDVEESRRLWRTCDSSLLVSRFSPDGDYLTSTVDDDLGTPTALEIREARTGRRVVTAKLPRGNLGAITWENDSHLLLDFIRPMPVDGPTTHDLYRVSLDGEAELVRSTRHDDPMSSPWSMVR